MSDWILAITSATSKLASTRSRPRAPRRLRSDGSAISRPPRGRYPRVDDFTIASDVGDDARELACHCLGHGEREPLEVRRQYEDFGGLEKGAHVVLVTRERDCGL